MGYIGFDNLRALFCEWAIGLKFGFYFNLYNLWDLVGLILVRSGILMIAKKL